MPRFTVKKVVSKTAGEYYSVRKDGKQISGHRLKSEAQAIMYAEKRKYELKEKRKAGKTIY